MLVRLVTVSGRSWCWGTCAFALAIACGHGQQRARAERPAEGGAAGAHQDCTECGGAGPSAGSPALGGDSSDSGALPAAMAGDGSGRTASEPELTVARVTIAQTLELPLFDGETALSARERNMPLLAGKAAVLRVFVEVAPSYTARPLLGVLQLTSQSGADTLLDQRTIEASSRQDVLGSTFDFAIDARDLNTDTSFYVRILDEDKTALARFPAELSMPLEAERLDPFELVVVPMISGGYGPDTSPPALEALRKRLLALYPVSEVELSLRAPLALGFDVPSDGDAWDEALDALYAVREADAPSERAFYYGLMAPAASYDDFCGAGCTIGYSVIAGESEVEYRGSIGIGVFSDGSGSEDAADTMAHELGHALGREHSPCGVPDETDPQYPYPGGGLGGVYAFDLERGELIEPGKLRDVMGYCTPVWVSDYTYRALFERLDHVSRSSFRVLSAVPATPYRVLRIYGSGASHWHKDTRADAPGGAPALVGLLSASGAVIAEAEARHFRVAHGRGGYVWLRQSDLERPGVAAVDMTALGGAVLPL
jgi:hypothetical protein